ncbi:Serine/threonine-protein kinase Sgk1 isoform X2 [Aix galericulata]|nr:Serine/threonine-protein kinase Sgk1 isoform X2 [Aix galericulata]
MRGKEEKSSLKGDRGQRGTRGGTGGHGGTPRGGGGVRGAATRGRLCGAPGAVAEPGVSFSFRLSFLFFFFSLISASADSGSFGDRREESDKWEQAAPQQPLPSPLPSPAPLRSHWGARDPPPSPGGDPDPFPSFFPRCKALLDTCAHLAGCPCCCHPPRCGRLPRDAAQRPAAVGHGGARQRCPTHRDPECGAAPFIPPPDGPAGGPRGGTRSAPPLSGPAPLRRHLSAVGGRSGAVRCWSQSAPCAGIFFTFQSQRNDSEGSRGVGSHLDLRQDEGHGGHPHRPEVQSILKISQPQEPELMNANPSPPVLLARHKAEEQFYAVKVLQKKAILKKKELFYHLQRERCFLEPRARFYAAEIASALGYLHSLNIVYRDLKPENILLDSQGHIVLTDFGLCKENIEHNGTTSTFCGTPEYLAPEVLHKQPYDRTVDWWCLGAVLYEMLYGLPPFYSRNTAEMYDNILNKPLQLKPNITNSARHLLEGLLQKDRTKRLGAKEDFMEIKSHIFFSPINWDDLINKKITPPFNPNVSGPSDLRHFDPEFTDEPVPNSIGQSPDSILITASVKEAAEAFLGFSYAPPVDSFL